MLRQSPAAEAGDRTRGKFFAQARFRGLKPYDTLIIGCGTAGAILAARLSEDPGRTVCVLEAGAEAGSA